MKDNRKQTKKLRHVSLWARRNEFDELEKAFSERWAAANDRSWPRLNDTLQKILTRPNKPRDGFWYGEGHKRAFWVCQRDATIAATVIQWLGTNCGFAFLRQCLEDAGYQIVETEKARELHRARLERAFKTPDPAPLPGYAALVQALVGPWEERNPYGFGFSNVSSRSFAGVTVNRSRPWISGKGYADSGWVFFLNEHKPLMEQPTSYTAVQMARKLKLIEHGRKQKAAAGESGRRVSTWTM